MPLAVQTAKNFLFIALIVKRRRISMATSFKTKQNINLTISILLFIIIGFNTIPFVHASDGIRGIFVSKIYKLLKTRQYGKAIIKCRKLRKKHLYKDYSYFLEGMAFYFKQEYEIASDLFSQSIALNNER